MVHGFQFVVYDLHSNNLGFCFSLTCIPYTYSYRINPGAHLVEVDEEMNELQGRSQDFSKGVSWYWW